MDILTVNAEQQLITIISAIARDPLSWRGWRALHINTHNLNDYARQDCLNWIESILQSYCKHADGRVYAAHGEDIHIICKGVSKDILEQIILQLQLVMAADYQVDLPCKVYDLSGQSGTYLTYILEKEGCAYPAAMFYYEDRDLQDRLGGGLASSTEAMKVLLVEDDLVARWMVRNLLKDRCTLEDASCAGQVFSSFNSYKPDLVFLDIGLPDVNGMELLEWMVEQDPSVRVVMLSANDDLDNIAGALRAGAVGFVPKPFVQNDLLHYMRGNTGGAAL